MAKPISNRAGTGVPYEDLQQQAIDEQEEFQRRRDFFSEGEKPLAEQRSVAKAAQDAANKAYSDAVKARGGAGKDTPRNVQAASPEESESFKRQQQGSRKQQNEERKRRQQETRDEMGVEGKRPISTRRQQTREIMERKKQEKETRLTKIRKQRGTLPYESPDEDTLRKEYGTLTPDQVTQKLHEKHGGDMEKVDADLRTLGVEVPEGVHQKVGGISVRVSPDGTITPVMAQDTNRLNAAISSRRADKRGLSGGVAPAFGGLSRRGKGHEFGASPSTITGRTIEQSRMGAAALPAEQGDRIKTDVQVAAEARQAEIESAIGSVRQEGVTLTTDDIDAAAASLAEQAIANSGVEYETPAARQRALDIETQKAKKEVAGQLQENVLAGQADIAQLDEGQQALVNSLVDMAPADAGLAVRDFIYESVTGPDGIPLIDGEPPADTQHRRKVAESLMRKDMMPYLPEDIVIPSDDSEEAKQADKVAEAMYYASDSVKSMIKTLPIPREGEVNGSKFEDLLRKAIEASGIDPTNKEALGKLGGDLSYAMDLNGSEAAPGAQSYAMNAIYEEAGRDKTLGVSGRAILDKYKEDGLTDAQFTELRKVISDAVIQDSVTVDPETGEESTINTNSPEFKEKFLKLSNLLHSELVKVEILTNYGLDQEALRTVEAEPGTHASDFINLHAAEGVQPSAEERKRVAGARNLAFLDSDGLFDDRAYASILEHRNNELSKSNSRLITSAMSSMGLRESEAKHLLQTGRLPTDVSEDRAMEIEGLGESAAMTQWQLRRNGEYARLRPFDSFIAGYNKIENEASYDPRLRVAKTARIMSTVLDQMNADDLGMVEAVVNDKIHPATTERVPASPVFELPDMRGVVSDPDMPSDEARRRLGIALDAGVIAADWLEGGASMEGIDPNEAIGLAQAIRQFAGETFSDLGIPESQATIDAGLASGILLEIGRQGLSEQVAAEMDRYASEIGGDMGVDTTGVRDFAKNQKGAASAGIVQKRRAAVLADEKIDGRRLVGETKVMPKMTRALMAWAMNPRDGISQDVWEEHGLGDEYRELVAAVHAPLVDGKRKPISRRKVEDPMDKVFEAKLTRDVLDKDESVRKAAEVAAKILLKDGTEAANFMRLINTDLEGRGGPTGAAIEGAFLPAGGRGEFVSPARGVAHLAGKTAAKHFAIPEELLAQESLWEEQKAVVGALYKKR